MSRRPRGGRFRRRRRMQHGGLLVEVFRAFLGDGGSDEVELGVSSPRLARSLSAEVVPGDFAELVRGVESGLGCTPPRDSAAAYDPLAERLAGLPVVGQVLLGEASSPSWVKTSSPRPLDELERLDERRCVVAAPDVESRQHRPHHVLQIATSYASQIPPSKGPPRRVSSGSSVLVHADALVETGIAVVSSFHRPRCRAPFVDRGPVSMMSPSIRRPSPAGVRSRSTGGDSSCPSRRRREDSCPRPRYRASPSTRVPGEELD